MNYYISNGNISNSQTLLGKFLPHSLQQFVLWPPFCLKSWNPDTISLRNTKICWNIEQYLHYYILNRNISNFQNFWANFCLVYSSRWLSGCIFTWNHGRQILSFRITLKIVPILKYDENFCRKLPKIAKFAVNLGYRGKFWTKWVLNK